MVSSPARPSRDWWEPAALIALGLFVVLSIWGLVDPRRPPALESEQLDVVITTLATVVSGAIAFLEWGRYRVDGQAAALYRAGAFLVLAVANLELLAFMLEAVPLEVGIHVAEPGQWPLWAGIITRAVAAILFVLGGLTAVRLAPAQSRSPLILFLAPALLVLMLTVMAAYVPSLPTLITPGGLMELTANPVQPPPGITLAYELGQLLPAAGFLFAAALSYLAFRRERAPGEAILAAGLTIAALSQVHTAVHPGAFTSIVTSGDLLRMLFYFGLLVGLVVENRMNATALRRAHLELRRLHEVEVAQATIEERARLAREIHDGLAQDLWYAKLKQSRLAQLTANLPDAHGLANEVIEALDSALAEARQAVMALRPSAGGSLLEVLGRYVEDFGDRFGIRAEFGSDGPLPEVDARTQAEVLRVVQEALNNVRKHADATVVRVEARCEGEQPVVRVTDNGRGFEPTPGGTGYGLHSMEERVQLIGGQLAVHSAPHEGTTVEIRLPVRGTA